ncbi:hypothetical protein ABZ746_27435 [Streptomyces sp. NPDC020096]
MNIDWGAFASVVGVSLVATLGLVGLFTFGIVGLSKQQGSARAGAYTAFAACAAAVAYGIYLIAG